MDQRIYTTEGIQPDQGREYWRQVCAANVGVDIAYDGPTSSKSFFARMVINRAGPLSTFEVTTRPSSSFLVSGRPPRAGQSEVLVITQLGGESTVVQQGNSATLAAGDFLLLDRAREFQVDFGARARERVLRVPTRSGYGDLLQTLDIAGLRIDGSRGAGAIASAFLRSYTEQAPGLTEAQSERLFGAMLQVLNSAALDRMNRLPHTHSRQRMVQLRTIRLHIEDQLHDPDLTPARIARAHGITRRHLDKLFENEPHTVSRLIWERRLLHSRRALAEPQLAHLSVTEIAYDSGFSSSSHFSRAFRARFGMTPRQARAQANQVQ